MRRAIILAATLALLSGAAGLAQESGGREASIRRTFEEGDYGLALERVNEALGRSPGDVSLLNLKRDVLWEMGEADSAAQVSLTLMERDVPHRAEHRRRVLECRLKNQKPPAVAELYGEDVEAAAADLVALLPRVVEATASELRRNELRLLLARSLLGLSRAEEALALLEHVLETGTQEQSAEASEILWTPDEALPAGRGDEVEAFFRRLIETAHTEGWRNQLRLRLADHLIALSMRPPPPPDRALQDRALTLWGQVIQTGTPPQRDNAWVALRNNCARDEAMAGDSLVQVLYRFLPRSTSQDGENERRLRLGELLLERYRPDLGEALLDTVAQTGTPEQQSRARGGLRDLGWRYDIAADAIWGQVTERQRPAKDMDLARAYKEKAIALSDPPRAEQYYRLACMGGGRDAVRANFERAVALASTMQERQRYQRTLADFYASVGEVSLAEEHLVRLIARGTGDTERSAVESLWQALNRRGALNSDDSGLSRPRQVMAHLPIERLLTDLAALPAEEPYPEGVHLLALYSKQFFEAPTPEDKAAILVRVANVCRDEQADFKFEAALSRAYGLVEGFAPKDAVLSQAVRLSGFDAYEVLSDLAPEHEESFIRYWSAMGPFEAGPHERDEEIPPEVRLDPGKQRSEERAERTWVELPALVSRKVDVGPAPRHTPRPHTAAFMYFATSVHVQADLSAQARFCGSGIRAVWLNDRLVFRAKQQCIGQAEHQADVSLRPGRNRILVKVANTRSCAAFFFRLCDAQGRAPKGIEVSPAR